MNKGKLLVLAMMLLPGTLFAQADETWLESLEHGIIGTLFYALIGIVLMILAVKVVDIITPGKLFHQISQEQNLPLAVFTSAVVLGVAVIIAAAIAG